jgi:hypothetical protein
VGVDAYVVLKVFVGYRSCPSQPDAWHQYAPGHADDSKGNAYSISPGFWKAGSGITLSRDLNRWSASIRAMVASGQPWHLVTTFNEWGEGTSVESAAEWSSASGLGAYLDALHANGSGASATPTPDPSATPTPILDPTPGTATPTPYTGPDPVVVAAGDIACDPASRLFSGGGGTAKDCHERATSDLILGLQPNAVLALGDDQYEQGALSAFRASYDPTWGRLKSITHPALGNHEYLSRDATGYFSYFGGAAGDPKKGYYSYALGSWHMIVINSNCSHVGGCGPGSPQERWLRADLAAHKTVCTLAYWHHPRFSSGEHGDQTFMQPIWQALYDGGADVVLNGHDHDYERFAPQDPAGRSDPTRGIREFVVGTGGRNHYGLQTVDANSEIRDSTSFGVLRLVLHPTSYSWQFIPDLQNGNGTFTDSGSASCR